MKILTITIMSSYHNPVLLTETVEGLNLHKGAVAVDCTLGGAGHSKAILDRIGDTGLLIGFDRDPDAIAEASETLSFCSNKILINANFSEIKNQLILRKIEKVDAVLFDLGVSSHQLDGDRGFSFMRDEALDRRMEKSGPDASYYVNNLPEKELADVIYKYGEERLSRKIARAVCIEREKKPINSTLQLADIISSAVGWAYRKEKIHPATRTFQAIRILVNDELSSAEKAIGDAIDLLAPGGVIGVISFHSLEDRIVKNIFRFNSGHCTCPKDLPVCMCGCKNRLRILTKKPIVPSPEEVRANPRSSCSKLRLAEKI